MLKFILLPVHEQVTKADGPSLKWTIQCLTHVTLDMSGPVVLFWTTAAAAAAAP